MAVREALHSGDLYLAESRHDVSFWNLVHSPEAWAETREQAYAKLALPIDASPTLRKAGWHTDASPRPS
jgi:hypothetical protein